MSARHLILLTPFGNRELERLLKLFEGDVRITQVNDITALRASTIDDNTTLLSFGSGVIVPADLLAKLSKPAYNIHAGPPAFPGRDPHHHAVYQQATEYGATLHIMTTRVDEGPIIGVETFPVTEGATPAELLAQANEAGFCLVERFGERLLDPLSPPALSDVAWAARKTTRSDLHRLSNLTPLIGEAEFSRRFRAFDGGAYNNLNLELHGQLFRIDKAQRREVETKAFVEFTETGLRQLLRKLRDADYRFARYGDNGADRHVIWRHDVDFSMHRAARLAEIEAEERASATYFVNPRCSFYNLLEPEIGRLLSKIRDLGHDIGLHFDAGAYDRATWTAEAVEEALARERTILETILADRIGSFSWHNPDISNLLEFDADEIGGLRNAYGRSVKRDYVYCSDSNGYWRYQPMAEVIAAGHSRLHLLTHPAWWTAEPMPPSERIDRAIMGRARAVRAEYDALLAKAGRRNLTE